MISEQKKHPLHVNKNIKKDRPGRGCCQKSGMVKKRQSYGCILCKAPTLNDYGTIITGFAHVLTRKEELGAHSLSLLGYHNATAVLFCKDLTMPISNIDIVYSK